jgi:CheY-like chemotaxis protein/nitrogen-specific signal transduction histidine kinase
VNWDVTADVQRNAELEAKRVEAEAASVAKSQFLATMSHEIRTPLNGVLGMIELLRGGRLDPEQRRRAEVAGDSARHLLAILNDILDLSRLEADRMTHDPRPVDVAALLREAAALNSAAADERGLALEVGIDPGLPPLLRCDPTRLRQVVLNLVGNAVKFTDAGSVRISARHLPAKGGQLEVEVRDTGIGIPEADQRRLFQRFVQVDGSSTRLRGGAGLGLAISRPLVELKGGGIDCRSAPGEGSAFRFRIPAPVCPAQASAAAPLEPAAAPPPPAAPQPAAATPRPGLRVLLAEDNATNRHIFAAFLAAAGHEVVIAENGARAVAAATAGGFDVVLMDIQMPELDGIAAAGRIRALPGAPGAVPIVALTANAMPGDRERYIAAGMDDYVAKPVTAAALDAALTRMALLCRA